MLQVCVRPIFGVTGRALRFGPLARAALVGAAAAVVIVSAVATWIESRVDAAMLKQIRMRAEDQVQLGIMPVVRAGDFEPPYSADKQADLAARLERRLARIRQSDAGIIRLNLFARDGTILYSDNPGLRGQTASPGRDELLGQALAGRPGIRVSRLEDPEDADLRPAYARAVEAYVPLVLNARVVGAYEFDTDLPSIGSIRPLVWGSLATVELIVFVSILMVLLGSSEGQPLSQSGAAGFRPARHTPLTRREFEALRLMADGLTYAQIAEVLVVDEETVRSHAKGVLRKLGQPDRASAVVAARRAGLLDSNPLASVQRSPGEAAGGTHVALETRRAKSPRPWLAAGVATDA